MISCRQFLDLIVWKKQNSISSNDTYLLLPYPYYLSYIRVDYLYISYNHTFLLFYQILLHNIVSYLITICRKFRRYSMHHAIFFLIFYLVTLSPLSFQTEILSIVCVPIGKCTLLFFWRRKRKCYQYHSFFLPEYLQKKWPISLNKSPRAKKGNYDLSPKHFAGE